MAGRDLILGGGGGRGATGRFGAITGTALFTVFHTTGIVLSAHDVIFNTGKILDAATPDQNNGVLGQVVTDSGNI